MSIAKLRKKMRQTGLRVVFWGALLVIFLLSCFLGYGSLTDNQGGGRGSSQAPAVVAKVGRQKITREQYNERVEQQFANYSRWGGLQFSSQTSLKKNVLDGLVDRIVKHRACKKERIKVSGREVDDRIDNLVDQQVESMKTQSGSQRRFALAVKKSHGSLSKLKQKLRASLNDNRDALAEEVLFDKLSEKIKAQVTVELDDYRRSTEEVKARHILIKPDSFKTPAKSKGKKGEGTEAEQDKAAEAKAKKKADDLLKRVKQGESFEELAKQYSEDYADAAQGGDLGWFARGRMTKPFEDAAFRMKKGELSKAPVKSEFGYHIIRVDDKRLNLPPDYNDVTYKCEKKGCDNEWAAKAKPAECPKCKSKKLKAGKKRRDELLEQYRTQKQDEHWRDYEKKLTDEAAVETLDPELKAYELELDGKTKEAVKLYKEALKSAYNDPWIKPGPINFRIAQLYERDGKPKEAIKYYQDANNAEEDGEVHLSLAKLYKNDKKTKKKAVEELKLASELSYDVAYRRQELKQLFEELGEPELAAKEQKLFDEAQQNRGFGAF